MNLQDTIKIHGYGAGTGSEPADSDYANTQTKNYLLKKQTHLNKLRKRSMPYPGGAFEDKKQILHGGGPGSGRKPESGDEEEKEDRPIGVREAQKQYGEAVMSGNTQSIFRAKKVLQESIKRARLKQVKKL
ncbi:MAG: hypothetical protein KGI50_06580 [Patescibacteria group bacterium]|nr:hypothetical protein [Patescibacteria group bacterium]MDE2439122.1 hypothetical protein [Patescibacteria group bacterium]